MLCKKLIVIVGILFLGGVARVSAQEDSVRLSKELVRKMQNMPNIEVGKGITFEPKNKLYKMTLRFSPIIGGVKNTSQEYIFDKEKRESLTLVKDVIISETLFFSTEKKRQSDIYVFCVHKHTDFDTVNPLDTSQWEFYLLPTADLDEKVGMQKRITLSSLINIGAVKCRYEEIRAKVDELIKRAE